MTLCSGYCVESPVLPVACGSHVPPPELMQPFGVVMLVPGAMATCFTVVPFGPVASV